tara:strand:+ start:7986 stop:8315 length:330 start_codon:yes stop_codon:yes gene_type:complete
MKKIIRATIVMVGLASAGLAMTSTPSLAGVSINLDFGSVATGYQDGYWDNNHHWHNWRSDEEMHQYRAKHGHKYNNWKRSGKQDRGHYKVRDRRHETRHDNGRHNGWKQ